MSIPFYINPATGELELTADPSPLRESLGKRFNLNEISTRAKTLSPTKSYTQKPYNWEQGNWWDLEDESVGNTKILEDFEITEEMRRRPNAEGGRIGFKRGKSQALLIRKKAADALKKVIDAGELLEFRKLAKEIDVPATTLRRVYDEKFAGTGVMKQSRNAVSVINDIIKSGVTDADKIKQIAKEKYKINIGDRNISRLVTAATDVSVENYLNDFKKMTSDPNYVPKYIKPATEVGGTVNQKEARKIAKETIEGFEKKLTTNINRRKKLKRAADPEKRLSDLVSKQMRKAKKRFKEIGKISLSKADLTFNRAQNTILKLANELINSNPDAILKDKALLDKISYRIDNNGNIIKIKPDLTKLIDPKADARFFHLGHGKRVELGGELLNVPANRNAVPFSLNMAFTKDAEKFIEANHNKPEMKSKIDKIIAKAKELKIQLRPDVPKGTFKNASGNPIRFIGYQHNAHPVLKVLDVVKTYMPKSLRAPGRLKIPAAVLALTTTSAKADSLEPSDKTQEASVLPAVIKDHPYLSSAAAVTAAAPKKVWEGVKWAAEKLTPLLTPAGSHVLHGGKYDLTSGTDLMSPAFWKHAVDAMGKTSKLGDATIPLKKRLKDLAWRGLLPNRFLPLISGTASVAAGPMLINDAAKWLQRQIDKEGLTGMIADQSGVISDEAGASLFMEDVVEEKKRKDAEGMDYAQGGIASLIK
jgi:ribosomal protein L7Ae-like RNA K-turn-binding protein